MLPDDATVSGRFEAQAARTPAALAVTSARGDVSYADLNARANRLARVLRAQGVDAEACVAVAMPRSADLIAALLAILKAGATYLCVDPREPLDRLTGLLHDVRLVLTSGPRPPALAALSLRTLDVNDPRVASHEPENLALRIDRRQAACAIMPPGSPDVLRRILVTHASIVRLVREANFISVRPADRVAHLAAPWFDAATFEIWSALLNGASIVVIDEETAWSPAALARAFIDAGVTTTVLPTALFNELAREAPAVLDELTDVLFGGDIVEPRWPRTVLERGGAVRLVHMYGPPEATTFSSWCVFDAMVRDEPLPLLGAPISGTRLYVLDRTLTPTPVGVAGELYVAGAGLARGYARQPAQTSSRFVADPYGAAGTRMFRTGDLARWRPDGRLEFMGRADAPTDVAGAEDLAAATVTDRYRAPRTPEEEILCAIFAEVLDVPRVGLDDDFFALGGHSLIGTRVVSRVRATLGVELAIRTLFESPTVAELSPRLREGGVARPPLVAQIRPTPLPASYAQQRLWFIDQLEGTSTEYNAPAALRLQGPLDLSALRRATNVVIARHESLRTTFAEIDGTPVQIIAPEGSIEIAVDDLSELDAAARHARVQDVLRREWETPFHLTRGPLVRMQLLRLGDEEHILIRTLHHIVSDGWSQGVFNRELMALYSAFREERANPLPPVAIQYADFALWQRQWLDGGVLDEGLAYWTMQLAGIPERLVLPTDRPRPVRQTFAADHHQILLRPADTLALKELSQEHHATLYMTMLAAFGALLARYSGQDDVVVGSPIANRQDEAVEDLIGFFVNALVLRLRIRPEQSFADVLRGVRQTTLDAYRHQDVPFERVVEALAPPRSLNTPPLFQVTFALQNAPAASPHLADLTVTPVIAEDLRVRFDLELHVFEYDGQLACAWIYNTALFDRWRIEQMARQHARVLAAIRTDANVRVGEITLLEPGERQQILDGWNPPPLPPPSITIPARFEVQAAARPDAIALIDGEARVTYATLNARANQLAHALVRKGVGPETLVAVTLAPSPDLFIALLGILKAGAAYMPLDEAWPIERWQVLQRSARPGCVLTTRSLMSRVGARTRFVLDDPETAAALQAMPVHNPTDADRRTPLHAMHPAYVLYTSGSTGTPKGVAVTHVGVLRLMDDDSYATLTEDEVMLQRAPLAFDASTFEIWECLLRGAQLVLSPPGPLDLAAIGVLLRKHRVTTLWLTAGIFHLMVMERLDDLAGVRQLLAGGDVLAVADVRRVLDALPACRVSNGYGPTEATVFSCCHRVDALAASAPSVPIGRPILHTRVYVLDERLQPSPVGVPGELYIAGAGLARGYIHQSALTASRFIADPYGPAGTRMYRTGDLARWRPDGHLEFMGRADNQVKIRGFRVEIGEVEHALRQCPGVGLAVVVATGEQADKRLVGYVVPSPGLVLDATGLRKQLEQRVPDHLVPSLVMVLDRLPLTPQGKVDRRALPAPEAQSREAYRAPRTAEEEIICTVFAEVLGVARVGLDDDFFALGGHSLLATRAVNRIRETLKVELPLREFFGATTVRDLAAIVAVVSRTSLASATSGASGLEARYL